MPEVLLKIRAAKTADDDRGPKRGPLLMEQALAAMHHLRKRRWTPVSLEIGFLNGKISFFARTDTRAAPLVESQLYAQYPEIDVERMDPEALAPKSGE